jgi:hypothetical protein
MTSIKSNNNHWRTQEFCSGGRGVIQQIQLRTREQRVERMGIWGAEAPYSGVRLNLQMSEPHILIGLLWMYFYETGN